MEKSQPKVEYWYPELSQYIECEIITQHSRDVYVITFTDPIAKQLKTRMSFYKELKFSNATV